MDASMIWVISSDPDTRRLIGLNLSKRGLGVLEVSSQGKLQDRPSRAKLQLIILDINQPDESGWEVADALRQSSETQGVPIILLLPTAPADRQLAPLQPVRWLEKPLAMDALLAQVWESLGQQRT